MGGGKDTPVVESTGVHCWEQPANNREVKEYEKRGVQINRKVYFVTDPALTERHEILITSRANRDGTTTTIAAADQVVLEVHQPPQPDSLGGNVLWRVMALTHTGAVDPPVP